MLTQPDLVKLTVSPTTTDKEAGGGLEEKGFSESGRDERGQSD